MPTDIPDRLRIILDYKVDEVRDLKQKQSMESLLDDTKNASAPRGFAQRIQSLAANDENALICEIKRKSPSAGDINLYRPLNEAANAYASGGGACLSVLTDGPSFGGKMADMIEARNSVDLPVLRKDFMIDPIQIVESRANGADAILIIMAAVDDALAKDLHECADELGLSVLLEAHNKEELERALKLPSPLVGVNNRDLRRFETDLAVTETLAHMVSNDKILISESGVRSPEDVVRLRKTGARGFLIGETFMRAEDPSAMVRATFEAR